VANDARRMAIVRDGPEWAAGDIVGLELWANVNDRPYVFVLAPIALMKGL
jgi:hypothetical protein